MKKIIFSLLFIVNVFALTESSTKEVATSGLDTEIKQGFTGGDYGDTQGKTPIQNIFQVVDWGLFTKEFEINIKTGICGTGANMAIGFKAHMIEPIGFFETAKKPLYFPSLGIDLGGNVIKSGTSRNLIRSESGRDAFSWSHFLYIPIMGMIFKKKMPMFCFANGDLALPFLSEFIPPYSKDILYKNMILPMIAMFSPQGLLSSVIDCGATTIANSLNGFTGAPGVKSSGKGVSLEHGVDGGTNITTQESLKDKGIQTLTFIRDSMFYVVGCLGFAPVGGFIPGQDPMADAEMLMYGSINLLHGASALMPKPFLYKQTTFSAASVPDTSTGTLAGPVDTMCAPKKYPLAIESQYVPQRVYPTVAGPHEMGMTTLVTSAAANVPGYKDQVVYIVWERRDYYAFAYLCPGNN